MNKTNTTEEMEIAKWEAEFAELRKKDAINRDEYNAACEARKANSKRKK
jgi:hypothetical protein